MRGRRQARALGKKGNTGPCGPKPGCGAVDASLVLWRLLSWLHSFQLPSTTATIRDRSHIASLAAFRKLLTSTNISHWEPGGAHEREPLARSDAVSGPRALPPLEGDAALNFIAGGITGED